MTSPLLPFTDSEPRSIFSGVLGWLMMILGGIGLPISVISGLMMIAHTYGTQTTDPIGICIVVLGPITLLITGFGLRRRLSWARRMTILLSALVIAFACWELAQGPRPTTTTYDASGVPTTVTGSGTNYYALPIIGVCVGFIAKLISRSTSAEFNPPRAQLVSPEPHSSSSDLRTWRVNHRGRDMMYYEEQVNGKWERLEIDGEMLMGRAHHAIYFASNARWLSYPEWARNRRSEIIARIKSEFRTPDYEYQGDD